ncbi:hypothetical protein ACRN9A_20090 [Shewanella frigidimarina]|uniref:hypothetical protein n=1 Tax=Shewanella frigidimarina TaxID=56812 RepID=UPI003D7B944A
MKTNFDLIKKTDNLLMLLNRMTSIIQTEHLFNDISEYDVSVEQQFLVFQLKQKMRREGLHDLEIKLAMDFVSQFLSCE